MSGRLCENVRRVVEKQKGHRLIGLQVPPTFSVGGKMKHDVKFVPIQKRGRAGLAEMIATVGSPPGSSQWVVFKATSKTICQTFLSIAFIFLFTLSYSSLRFLISAHFFIFPVHSFILLPSPSYAFHIPGVWIHIPRLAFIFPLLSHIFQFDSYSLSPALYSYHFSCIILSLILILLKLCSFGNFNFKVSVFFGPILGHN